MNKRTDEKEIQKKEREQKIKLLKDYTYLEDSIKNLEEECEEMSKRMGCINNSINIKELAEKKKELVELCEKELIKRYNIKKNIYQLIYKLDNEKEREIIINKYIKNMTYEKISEKMHYSDRQIMRIHNKAIDKMEFDCHGMSLYFS